MTDTSSPPTSPGDKRRLRRQDAMKDITKPHDYQVIADLNKRPNADFDERPNQANPSEKKGDT
jgi:hypothetical protein